VCVRVRARACVFACSGWTVGRADAAGGDGAGSPTSRTTHATLAARRAPHVRESARTAGRGD
jgi:hypothetical protein